MQTMIIILKSGVHLISKVEQLEEEPSCHLQDPYFIKDDGTLQPWPRYTDDVDILIYSEFIATIVNATSAMKAKYKAVTK
ncbi:MAG: hypothetical protein CM15mV21_0940 [Eurybiavirus sp.]|nr:MAG: hypothetical protein CM15mV21_0940 [Eurybiavirus sp.]